MIGRAVSMAIEKPRFWASATIAVFMPTTWPAALTSGPPELPGLMAASVWMRPWSSTPSAARSRSLGRDDAPCDGGLATEVERVADGDDLVADAQVVGRPELGGDEVAHVTDLDHGHVVVGRGADEGGGVLGAVAQDDGDVAEAGDDVGVGEDEAVLAAGRSRSPHPGRRRGTWSGSSRWRRPRAAPWRGCPGCRGRRPPVVTGVMTVASRVGAGSSSRATPTPVATRAATTAPATPPRTAALRAEGPPVAGAEPATGGGLGGAEGHAGGAGATGGASAAASGRDQVVHSPVGSSSPTGGGGGARGASTASGATGVSTASGSVGGSSGSCVAGGSLRASTTVSTAGSDPGSVVPMPAILSRHPPFATAGGRGVSQDSFRLVGTKSWFLP